MGYRAEARVKRFADAYALVNDPDGCPHVTTVGTTTTVMGGCYKGSDKLVGSLVIENFPFTRLYDPGRATRLVATRYGIEDVSTFDGTYDLDPARGTRDIVLSGTGNYVDLHLVCETATTDLSHTCTAASTSSFELGDIRGEIDGAWSNERPFKGTITLRATDAITFDLSGTVDDCIPYQLSDGRAGCVLDYR